MVFSQFCITIELGMVKKLYVGNLPYSVTEDTLWGVFSSFGEVKSINLIIDRDSGRSKGFAFVEMFHDKDAEQAINGLKTYKLDKRQIRVSEAKTSKSNNNFRERRFPSRY